jgi:hypothetical protein
MPPLLWQARTVKNVLIERHGMDPAENPVIQCACGRRVHTDVCVDLTPLPIGIRKALGLHLVDYLCDGCQTRLFRELHIGEEEFYSLLGAPEEVKEFHRERDAAHQAGCDLRPEPFRPKHSKVAQADVVGKKLGQVSQVSRIPILRSRRSHDDAAQFIHNDRDNPIVFPQFDPILPEDTQPVVVDLTPIDDAPPVVVDESIIDPDELPADQPLPDGVSL